MTLSLKLKYIMNKYVDNIQIFYSKNRNLVTSPFTDGAGLKPELLDRVYSQLGIKVGSKAVLDIGCGRAILKNYFSEYDSEYFGIDLNRTWLSRTEDNLYANVSQANAVSLPFKSETFDLIICMDSYEHFPDQAKVSIEMRRMLKKDGHVFLSLPNYSNVAGIVKKIPRSGW